MDGIIDYMASKVDESQREKILALKNVGPLHLVCKDRKHTKPRLIASFT